MRSTNYKILKFYKKIFNWWTPTTLECFKVRNEPRLTKSTSPRWSSKLYRITKKSTYNKTLNNWTCSNKRKVWFRFSKWNKIRFAIHWTLVCSSRYSNYNTNSTRAFEGRWSGLDNYLTKTNNISKIILMKKQNNLLLDLNLKKLK